jgi:hypothetical protein
MKWLLERLREPSTAAGVGAVAIGLDAYAQSGSWVGALVAGLGAVAAVQREGAKE